MMSVTSSWTPGSVVNSCAVPSILTEDTAQRVAERVAEAAVERLDDEDAAEVVDFLVDDPRLQFCGTHRASCHTFLSSLRPVPRRLTWSKARRSTTPGPECRSLPARATSESGR